MEQIALLKRIYFYLDDADRRAAEDSAAASYPSFSEFVRLAVMEKLDRQKAAAKVELAASELTDAVAELRQEVGRLRTDLVADNDQARAAIEAAAADSLRKNEELTRHFVLALTTAVGGTKPAPSRRRTDLDDDAPMAIPG